MLRDSVGHIADFIAKGNMAAAKKEAARLAKSLDDPGDVMRLLSYRIKKTEDGKTLEGTGFGLGPKPGAIQPDGIEDKVKALARTPLSPAALAKQSEALERAAYVAAAVSEVIPDTFPAGAKGDPKVWKAWSQDMHKASLEFAKAVRTGKPDKVKMAADKLNDVCIRCHNDYRP
jgi:hypothetical protein